MEIKKILWLEDQYEDFSAYRSALFRSGYLIDFVKSVSEAEEKIREKKYTAYIFDIKVLPGDTEEWSTLDIKKREGNPNFDSNLGLELLRSLFNSKKARVKLDPPIKINPQKVIVFSVVYDEAEEISSFGIPEEQIVNKSAADLTTLPELIKKIENET
ncbi:MAG: hypothetical protein KAT34_12595 [Candidatus Aminicenantes bacterium]|nr:hypothetical protein [Candidatus Aminicenantes bacterium]